MAVAYPNPNRESPVKQIRYRMAITLTVLFVPGGLPIALAVWAYRRRARHGKRVSSRAGGTPERVETTTSASV